MSTTKILLGTRVTLTATFNPAGGAPVDPTTVVLKIRKPDGTMLADVTTASMDHVPASGVYEYAHTPDAAGRWWYSWRGNTVGGIAAVAETSVTVDDRVVVA